MSENRQRLTRAQKLAKAAKLEKRERDDRKNLPKSHRKERQVDSRRRVLY